MTNTEVVAKLQLFAGLSLDQQREVVEVMVPVEFPAGTVFISEGTSVPGAFVIDSGQIEIDGRTGDHHDSVMVEGSGSVIAELALIDEGYRSPKVSAKTPVRAFHLARENLIKLIQREPGIGLKVLSTLARRFQELQTRVRETNVMARPVAAEEVDATPPPYHKRTPQKPPTEPAGTNRLEWEPWERLTLSSRAVTAQSPTDEAADGPGDIYGTRVDRVEPPSRSRTESPIFRWKEAQNAMIDTQVHWLKGMMSMLGTMVGSTSKEAATTSQRAWARELGELSKSYVESAYTLLETGVKAAKMARKAMGRRPAGPGSQPTCPERRGRPASAPHPESR